MFQRLSSGLSWVAGSVGRGAAALLLLLGLPANSAPATEGHATVTERVEILRSQLRSEMSADEVENPAGTPAGDVDAWTDWDDWDDWNNWANRA